MPIPPLRHLFNTARYYWLKAVNYITVHCVTFSPVFPPFILHPTSSYSSSVRFLAMTWLILFLRHSHVLCARFPFWTIWRSVTAFHLPIYFLPFRRASSLRDFLPEFVLRFCFRTSLVRMPPVFLPTLLISDTKLWSDFELLNSVYMECQRASGLFICWLVISARVENTEKDTFN
jgi:hypothetical protein